jgi:hypothetical protein
MKQKDKILSSLIIACVAGFIYYAFADYDTFKRIPQLAFETIKTAVTNTTQSDKDVAEINEKNIAKEEKEDINSDIVSVKTPASNVVLEDGIFAHIPDFTNFVRVDDFGGKVYIDEERLKKLEKLEKLQDFGFNSDFGNGMIAFANNDEMGLPLDSNELKVRIKIKNLDSLNFYIDNSMLKLNESLSKLTEQLQSEEFLNSIPEIDLKDLKDFDVEVDVDEIKDAIKESMKDFDENMKEFKFDMKEFKDSMKQFKENMNDLKKNMKELDSTKMMKFNKKIEIIDS